MKKSQPKKEKQEDGLWSGGSFVEAVSSEDMEEKKKTFYKKHDEDMNFTCRKCNAKISAHNKDWHNGMCDDCFNKTYFQDS